ncbi:MAG: hypothetical protein K6E40_17470 [Desulfovibrio sp.]|nr:hypothetical protein [Desulfovibrio sp.]
MAEPQPRRPWTRDDLRAAVRAVRAMTAEAGLADEPGPHCLQDVDGAVPTADEQTTLRKLR